eukprot:gb/GEZN01005478.1/.p1 GENE.gb/GEZN01005478.1/~~gb/GEZN01005478.1/.p1  ORF type:complete len:397 (-),score=138.29 gb/GEZN01005478.1/:540-1730(-)
MSSKAAKAYVPMDNAAVMKGFAKICKMTHTQQGVWFLNGFWPSNDAAAEQLAQEVYKFVVVFQELENDGPVIKYKGKKATEAKSYVEGCDLDPHKSHRFLETLGETLTVQALRKKLEQIDVDKNKRMALSEYLVFKYDKTPLQLVEAPQGSDEVGIAKAQAKMAAVQEKLAAVQENIQQVEEQTAEVKRKLEETALKLEQQKAQEISNAEAIAQLAAAKEELAAALAELKKQEDEFAAKKAELEAKSHDQALGVVQRNRASNMLAQMLAEDPMPLRKAKITQEAALKRTEKAEAKAKKAQVALEKAIEESKQAQIDLNKAKEDLAASKSELEESQKELAKEMNEAEEELEECKRKGGVAPGAIWWMEKELKEARKYGSRGNSKKFAPSPTKKARLA